MPAPKITVITTTLNSETTIARCLDSVCDQTYLNTEHLIIDGLSTDNTISIIQDYVRRYSHISFISEKDEGIYNAMNKGLKLSSGDWIFFLGSDDILYDKHVLSKIFADTDLSNQKIIYGNVMVDGDSGWAKHGQVYDGPFDINKILKKNICHQGIFYNKNLVKEVGLYNESYTACADWDYNLRCFAKVDFFYIDTIIALFSGGGASLNTIDVRFSKDFSKNVVKYFDINPDHLEYKKKGSPFYSVVIEYNRKKFPVKYFFYRVNQKLRG